MSARKLNKYQLVSPVASYEPSAGQWWLCPQSQLALDVVYESDELLLPLSNKPTITLGEGKTPLLELKNLSRLTECKLWAKCEFLNPTGSFKDRGSVVEVSKALELGNQGIVCASTGNMAASLAAYAAQTGLECVVVVPAATPESKLQQALVCGATLEKVDGNYDQCVRVAETIAKNKNYFLCGDYVIRREGQKSIGCELAESNLEIDTIVVPVGNGTVAVAAMKGFDEKRGAKKLPKLIGIQAEKVNPIEKAWRCKQEISALQNTQTIASAFNVGNPLDGYLVLDWLDKSGGSMDVVSDAELLLAQKMLAASEGIFVESTAATTLAGVLKNKQQFQGQVVVLILTGSGLKERG
jgi:threonine synthase